MRTKQAVNITHNKLPFNHTYLTQLEAPRLNQHDDELWLLELYVKKRDANTGWKGHRRDAEGNFTRRWLPACRLQLDDNVGRYYHYIFQNLDGFENAGQFPGGYTRTTEQKLLAAKISAYIDVDLTPLEQAAAELAEVQREIKLTDQNVCKIYGLVEEEIAILEGRA